jgi:serine/threonine-protein kinase
VEPDPLPAVEGLPHAVSALVGRCLEKRPSDRPSSAELAHVLAGIAAGAPGAARGYVPDWAESGEDTTILPSQQSYPDVIRGGPVPGSPAPQGSLHASASASASHAEEQPPVRNSRFAALRSGPVVMSAAAAGASLRPAYDGNQPPGSPPGTAGKGKSRNDPPQNHTRRIMFAAGAVLLLGTGTYGWSLASGTGHDPAGTDDKAQPSVVAATGKCVVSYAVQEDANHQFKAKVTVANRSNDDAIEPWKLWFILPGDQILSGTRTLEQSGNTVTMSSPTALAPLKAVTVPVTGAYTRNNTAPLAFMLNGKTCETFVSAAPGAPARQVEHLSNGETRLSTAPSSSNPLPGVSINPTNGTVVISPTKSTPPTTGATTGATKTTPTAGPTTSETGKDPDPGQIKTTSPTPSPSPTTSTPTTPSVPPTSSPALECIPDLDCPEGT